MKEKIDLDVNYGKQYGKPDIERLGLFVEMPYMNGKGYVTPFPKNYPPKGRNILTEGPKSKCGTQHGYFEDEFKRLFIGEAVVKPSKKKPKEKTKAVPFMSPGNPKWHSTPGDFYGCFGGNIEAFSNARRPKPKYVKQPINFLGSRGKGGGCGYPDIGLSKYPEHTPEPYRPKIKPSQKEAKRKGPPMIVGHFPQPFFDRNPYEDPKGKLGSTYVRPREIKSKVTKVPFMPTGPAKWPGGSHAGCFDQFPEWKTDRKPKPPTKRAKENKKYFYPQSMGLKTMQTFSILNRNTELRVNCQNYSTYEPNYTQYLLN